MIQKEIVNSEKEYKALAHCRLPLIREGFEEYITQLPFSLKVEYCDLSSEGIMLKLDQTPDIIILLQNEADADYGLSYKIKLFAPRTPLLIIMPEAPNSYLDYLKSINVDKVLVLPFDKDKFCNAIETLLTLPLNNKD